MGYIFRQKIIKPIHSGVLTVNSRQLEEKKYVRHLGDLEAYWRMRRWECPFCHRTYKFEELEPLSMNKCKKCSQEFYVPRKIGDYYLVATCGEGGMGSVYEAVSHRFPHQKLAMKLLSRRARENPPNIRAILNEAEVSSHFRDSEYIASSLDSGYIEDEFFIVMPLVEGEGLDKRIERFGKLPPQEVLTLTKHVLAAEQHIYAKGYLFRDMKPENIIVNKYGYAILLDFGLCIPLEKAKCPDEEFISGSPYYIPPERLLGNPEDANSEIYSIGMVMYHALTGTTIYDADELEALARRHVATLRVKNASKMTGIPTEIAQLLEAMIKVSPQERPQTFKEVFDAICKIQEKLGN